MLKLCIGLLIGAASPAVFAQAAYPTKPVRIVVPFAPGGGVDLTARILAQRLTEGFKQSFIVENRTGASGIIGTESVVKAAPDGYTLLAGSQTTQAVVPAIYRDQVRYDTTRDLVPVAEIARAPFLIVVHPSLPVKSVADLIKLAKEKPGQVRFGAASGGTPHMAGELFKLAAKIEMQFVPYKGEGPAIADAMGGHISLVFSNLPVGLPLARDGKLRGIAVTSAQRVPTAPEFPTASESGLPGFDAFTWFGLFAPSATPREIVVKLNAETVRALNAPDTKEKMAAQGMFTTTANVEDFGEFVKKETVRWTQIVKESGVKAE
ncbi:MAG TPA: tripartite tricarboxylate transporter substrate binding protein [Burkholderiales bacterium]